LITGGWAVNSVEVAGRRPDAFGWPFRGTESKQVGALRLSALVGPSVEAAIRRYLSWYTGRRFSKKAALVASWASSVKPHKTFPRPSS